MNLLTIGNSFSCDATRYLHGIARADKKELEIINISIGGCSLERHYRNMLGDKRDYTLLCNGENTGFNVTLKEALLNRNWDVITLQQASPVSAKPESYQPYANALADYIRLHAPKAKILIQQTWAYEKDSDRLFKIAKYETPEAMLNDIVKAYDIMKADIQADGLIPSGELFAQMLEKGIDKIHRDTFHASYGLGRYTLALLWYRMLFGVSVAENTFRDFDVEISEEEIALAKDCVDSFAPTLQK